jgi:hypothetical protein
MHLQHIGTQQTDGTCREPLWAFPQVLSLGGVT